MLRKLPIVFVCVLSAAACSRQPSLPAAKPGTLAIVNARVWTGDDAHPWAEALVIDGATLSFVGTSDGARRANAAQVVDAGGRLMVPGFTDAHVHFRDAGFALASVQLRDAGTREEFVARIKAFAATVPAGTWIMGGNWDHTLWGGELPTRGWIDAATPDHPVWLNRLDGHMSLANGVALKLAGVTRATKDVAGGAIVRDSKGEPTGVLKDNAMGLVDAVVPEFSQEMKDRALLAAMKYVNEQGVTTVHNMGSWDDLETFARAARTNSLTTRIYAVTPLADWQKLRDAVAAKVYGGADGRGDEWLRVGGLKGFMDGSLGSHTAAFDEPFADAPKDRGLLLNPPEKMYEWISGADKAGLQVMVHAIGDRAIGMLLDIYERVEKEDGARDRRFRVEHTQHLRERDIPRFAQLDVIASMQPYHAIDDGRWAEQLIGKRIATTYAFRSLLDAKARLAFGSDWSVAPATPLEGIYAAVTRRTLDDKNPDGWVPAQKITVEEALRAYTLGGAYASFDESRKGTLMAGKLADLVMIDRDLFSIPPEQIREAKVLATVVGGKVVSGSWPETATQ
ncbi:MAG TPA: amidohydrolase [Steroidobacteraceae bacterium]|nr:amidohydrolase [Steroidobacteraceae bacterium]